MGGPAQPFMYSAVHSHGSWISSGLPEKPFDPKAATRASWEPKSKPKKQSGPYLSFNRHPDSHMFMSHRSNEYSLMGPRTKSTIKWIRRAQLVFRVGELNASLGLLILMCLVSKIGVVDWIVRIFPGVNVLLCAYGIYHLGRPAGDRTPASSAAYQMFSGLFDLIMLVLFAFAAYAIDQNGGSWIINIQGMAETGNKRNFLSAMYYLCIGAGVAQFISLIFSAYLGIMFRKITLMPPDMNPLEDHLTARPKHKKSKSSVSTLSTDEKRLSTPLESRYSSGLPHEDVSRGPTIPFMHTRGGSQDSRMNLPSRQPQIGPGSRGSEVSLSSYRTAASTYRGSYVELDPQRTSNRGASASPKRPTKFTENWVPSDSLVSRTNNRYHQQQKNMAPSMPDRSSQSYAALSQPYNLDLDYESDDDENVYRHPGYENDEADLSNSPPHPNPLRQHPTSDSKSKKSTTRAQTPYRPWATNSLTEISSNTRRASNSHDITDQHPSPIYSTPRSSPARHKPKLPASPGRGQLTSHPRPYGNLSPGLEMNSVNDSDRKISSGNDWNERKHGNGQGMRRNVSGKVIEEGRGGY